MVVAALETAEDEAPVDDSEDPTAVVDDSGVELVSLKAEEVVPWPAVVALVVCSVVLDAVPSVVVLVLVDAGVVVVCSKLELKGEVGCAVKC